ncbi:thioesterase family protein [Williamsia sp.]|uniref:thioesterase family protein n=1 Tax=Williamsia sp. TaxID=1872085 RepID=UPI002F94E6AB
MPSLDVVNTLRQVGTPTSDRIEYTASIDPVFTIGPKVHGGTLQMLTANAALAGFIATAPGDEAGGGARQGSEDDKPASPGLAPVAVATNFLGAPEPAVITLQVWVRKRGRRVSLVDVEVHQNGRNLVHSTVTLGTPDTQSHYSAPSSLTELPAEPGDDVVYIEDSPMGEIMHLGAVLDIAIDEKSIAFARGQKGDPVFRMWVRPKTTTPDGLFAVLAGDLSAPVVMNLGLFGWAPTMQLTTYLRRNPAPGWLRLEASSTEVGHGWFEQDHVVIDSTGNVVVQSRQLALIPAAN